MNSSPQHFTGSADAPEVAIAQPSPQHAEPVSLCPAELYEHLTTMNQNQIFELVGWLAVETLTNSEVQEAVRRFIAFTKGDRK